MTKAPFKMVLPYIAAGLFFWGLAIWVTGTLTAILPILRVVTWNEWRWALVIAAWVYANIIIKAGKRCPIK